jgi:hypothetical protein
LVNGDSTPIFDTDPIPAFSLRYKDKYNYWSSNCEQPWGC